MNLLSSLKRAASLSFKASGDIWSTLRTGSGRNVTGYAGAAQNRRLSRFSTSDEGPNRLLVWEGEVLRARCRQLVRSVTWAASAADSYAANVVGTGIRPRFSERSTVPRETSRRLLDLWEQFAEQADAIGADDFYALQEQAARTLFHSGELWVLFRPRRPGSGLAVPLQLQCVEADLVPTMAQPESERLIAGIETDALGRPVYYHMLREHPRDRAISAQSNFDTVRIPASEALHIYHAKRPGQLRGEPVMAPGIVKTYQLLLYDDAELDRKGMAASLYASIKQAFDETGRRTALHGEKQADDDPIPELEPNTLLRLREGEELDIFRPDDLPAGYEPFVKLQLHMIATSWGITYEQMTGDLGGVNLSSIRAGEIEFRRRTRQIQRRLITQLCRPVWKRFVRTAFLAGVLEDDQFPANEAEYNAIEWQLPRREYSDPLKQTQADILDIQNGITSRSAVITERGGDPEETDAQIAEDQDRARRLGLVLPGTPVPGDAEEQEDEQPPVAQTPNGGMLNGGTTWQN